MRRIFTRHRFLIQGTFDAGAWFLGIVAATLLRFDFGMGEVLFEEIPLGTAVLVGLLAGALQVLIGSRVGLYVHRWRYGTFEEVTAAVRVMLTVTGLLTIVNLLPPLSRPLPVSVPVVGGFLALFVMGSGRFVFRTSLDRSRLAGKDREPVIIVGAGEGGLRIINSMITTGPYHPVALLDDNPDLAKLVVKGVPVVGTTEALADVAAEHGASKVVVAIPSASSELIRQMATKADAAGLELLVLPPVAELLSGGGVADVRPVTEADLLGRREITLDIASVAGYLTGRRVLVTGAGGSIGSELCRQINRFGAGSLIMLDRDESALQAVQLSIEGKGLLDRRELVVCCIRDPQRLEEVFEEHRPEVVFHAAALKHLPLLEMHPEEGWKTNVWGTQNLLELSGRFGVERFVNISTDKAADATSVLGRTKRLAEQLTSHAGGVYDGTYLSVRFGNVLGSRGSVVPLFRSQIEAGGPVTVTHPDVTRFFMTIPEACELVIQAGALGSDQEVLVLDMGEPVRIADLAQRLVAESGRDIEIVYTGLRPGEKLHEILFGPGEQPQPSEHKMISRVRVPALTPSEVMALDPYGRAAVIELRERPAPRTADVPAERTV